MGISVVRTWKGQRYKWLGICGFPNKSLLSFHMNPLLKKKKKKRNIERQRWWDKPYTRQKLPLRNIFKQFFLLSSPQHPKKERATKWLQKAWLRGVLSTYEFSSPRQIQWHDKSFKKWTQMNAFIDLSPLREKIGEEIKSLTISMVLGFCLLLSIE